MKKCILFLLLLPVLTFGQSSQGKIKYEETVKLQIKLDNEDKAFLSKLPTERTFNHELIFKDNESLYKSVANEDLEIQEESDGHNFVFKMDVPDNQLYCDHANQVRIERKDFLGKYFLIQGEPNSWKWKLTSDAKEIQGFACQKAIYSDTSETVVAWYTPQIAIPYGPASYGKLPGMILQIELNEGTRIITATNITLDSIEEEIEIPTKGKKVTQAEFDEIVDKKMKEMGATRGKGGSGIKMIITSDHNH